MQQKLIIIVIIGTITTLIFLQRGWQDQEIVNFKNSKIEIMCNSKIRALNKLGEKNYKAYTKEYRPIKLEAINAKKTILKKYGFNSIVEYGAAERKNRNNRKLNAEIFEAAYAKCGSEIDFVPLSSIQELK